MRTTSALAATAALLALAGCGSGGDDGSRRATDPAGEPGSDASSSSPSSATPQTCPGSVEAPPSPGAGFGASGSAGGDPVRVEATSGFACTYRLTRQRGWRLLGAARPLEGAELAAASRGLAASEPARADQVCTMDHGPVVLLVLRTEAGPVRVTSETFGCGTTVVDGAVTAPTLAAATGLRTLTRSLAEG